MMEYAAATDAAVASELTSSEDPQTTALIDLERLGRERPASLPHLFSEIGFVISAVGSLMMSEYFISGFNVVLPQISEALDIADSLRTWPAGVISLTTAALLLPFARLGDQYGARTIYLGGHTWLLLWSIVCGFSQNYIVLVVCRAMQGIGVGAFMPNSITILSNTYRPGPRKNMVFALYGAMGCLGFYFGILMAGICARLLNWSWFFWIGTFFEAVVLGCGWLTVPKTFGTGDPTVRMDCFETVLGTTPIQTALWFTPLAGGGFLLALAGGFILHLVSGRILLMIGGITFVPSALLLALIPQQSTSGQPSQAFIYWAYIFPAMVCATLGVDIMFNVTNVFITTSMPIRLQAAAGGLITSLLYLGITLWLGVAELAISTKIQYRGGSDNVTSREQYQIGFWLATGLAITSTLIFTTVKIGTASSGLTADEKNGRDDVQR
ncbi:hypothetical protein G7054_g9305 [Neopestalotiopsis clavispora]|nr:hypothetical protein G7054_g9305 [Neopestalotiopsis clavispora]